MPGEYSTGRFNKKRIVDTYREFLTKAKNKDAILKRLKVNMEKPTKEFA